MNKITPHLWFDKEAKEAGTLYTSLFPDSRVNSTITLHDTPSGSVDVVTITLAGQELSLLSAGPLFKFNPSISFLVACDTTEEVDELWKGLAERGSALMELGSYPWSERYGWTADRFGLSWQVMLDRDGKLGQKIVPSLMYVGAQAGRAENAIRFYTSIFRNSGVENIARYDAGEEPDPEGTVKHAVFTLEGQRFAAMDSAHAHGFAFNEAVSLMVQCDNQEEIDFFWDKLSADPSAEACGWLKDRYGVSWQVVPRAMSEMMEKGTPEQLERVTKAFLPMKKFDLATLDRAYAGR